MHGVIDVDNVVKHFQRKEVLKGVSCELGTGVTALLGPNGAGKTTLFNILGLRSKPSSGSCTVLGVTMVGSKLREARRNIGFLPQRFAFPRSFTAVDYVRYHLWLRDMRYSATLEPAERALQQVDLAAVSNTRMKRLSGGMLRRVGIAAAIAGTPKVILLDEPTVGLDPEQRMMFRDLLRELSRHSCILLATHLADDVQYAASRALILKEGKIIFDDEPAELELQGVADEHDRELGSSSALEIGYARVMAAVAGDDR